MHYLVDIHYNTTQQEYNILFAKCHFKTITWRSKGETKGTDVSIIDETYYKSSGYKFDGYVDDDEAYIEGGAIHYEIDEAKLDFFERIFWHAKISNKFSIAG